MMAIDPLLALKAHKLWEAHRSNKVVRDQMKLDSTAYAQVLVNVGRRLSEIVDATLDANDIAIIRALAGIHRDDMLNHGSVSSPKSKHVSWCIKVPGWPGRRSRGWAARVIKKRLEPLGFVEHRANGHIWLTPAGWALANALPEQVA